MESLCVRGSRVVEDRMGWGDHFLFVIDGASGLTPAHVTKGDSDAAWLAEGLRRSLLKLLPQENYETVEILSLCAEELKQEYSKNWEQYYHTDPDYPSAGIAIVRQRRDRLECFALGDCTVAVERVDGTIQTLEETELSQLDRSALAEMVSLSRKTGCTILEAKQALNDVLIHNRNLRNHEGGYWIFDPSGKGIPHGRTMGIPISEFKAITIMTDGFSQLIEPFGVASSAEDLHRMMTSAGIATLAGQLFARQEADANCGEYPRFKMRDDTTAILAVKR